MFQMVCPLNFGISVHFVWTFEFEGFPLYRVWLRKKGLVFFPFFPFMSAGTSSCEHVQFRAGGVKLSEDGDETIVR